MPPPNARGDAGPDVRASGQRRTGPRLIVGLGNPGPKYRDTRHNVGFRVIDLLAERWGIPVNERRPTTLLGRGMYRPAHPSADGDTGGDSAALAPPSAVVLAKPRTFMNHSGEAVAYLLARFGGPAARLLIIYDEMALAVGRLRLRAAGSDAGHNGLRSIIQATGTTAFPRLRIGIGAPALPAGAETGGAVGHVLGRFTNEEAEAVDDAIRRAAAAIECLLTENIDTAMNRYN